MGQWRAYMQQAGKRTLGSTTKADQVICCWAGDARRRDS